MRHTASGTPAHTSPVFRRLALYLILRLFIGPVLAYRLALGRA